MSVKEKLEKALSNGTVVPQELIDSAYGIKAATDELADRQFLEKYGYLPLFNDLESGITSPLLIPNLKNVITLLGIEDDSKETENPRTKVRKFLDDFPSKKDEWKKIIVNDKRLGDRGWETVKDVWKRAMLDDMNYKIAEERQKDIENAPLRIFGKDLFDVPGAYTAASILFPRSTERLQNGGSVEAKDVLLDLGENGMQMVPGAGWVATGRRIPKVGNLVTRAFAKADKALPANYLGEGLRNIGGMSKNLAGNSVAPFASELADAMVYDENSGMDSRADFSLGDAAIGALVNQAADRGIYHMLSPKAATMEGSLGRNTEGLRNFILNLGRSASKLGDDYAAQVRAMASTPNVHAPGRLSKSELQAARTGSDIKSSVTPDEYQAALKQRMILDAIDNNSIFPRGSANQIGTSKVESVASNMLKDDPYVLSGVASGMGTDDYLKAADKAIRQKSMIEHETTKDKIVGKEMRKQEIDEKMSKLNEDMDKGRISEKKGIKKHDKLLDEYNALDKEIEDLTEQLPAFRNIYLNDKKDFGSVDAVGAFDDLDMFIDPNMTLSGKEINKIFSEHPAELVNYSVWHGKGRGAATNLDKFGNIVNQALPSLAVNKAGKNEWAKQLISEAMKKDSEETHNAPKQRRASAEVKAAMSNAGGLTDEDKAYLAAIAEKPNRVTTGYSSKDDPDGSKFRMWMLVRGNDILSEFAPSAYRPTFDVE